MSRFSYKLVEDLEAELIKPTGLKTYQRDVPFHEAFGILFLCPYCFHKNGGSEGTHMVQVWWKDPGKFLNDNPIWKVSGSGLHDLTLKPSIDLTRGKNGKRIDCWHGFITNGVAT